MVMNNKVSHLDSIGRLLEKATEDYHAGIIKGLQIQYVYDDGRFLTGSSGGEGFTYIERIGLLEAAKADIIFPVMLDDDAL
jgi:hypothetical protein